MNLCAFKQPIRQGKNIIIIINVTFFANEFDLFVIRNYRVRVPPRAGSTKIEMKGIFVGAKVVQGHDWEWGGQDGGKNYLLLCIYELNNSVIIFDSKSAQCFYSFR